MTRSRVLATTAVLLLFPRAALADSPAASPTGESVGERRVELVSDSPQTSLQFRWRGSADSDSGDAYLREHDWRDVCVAPCSASVAADGTFRLSGPDVTPSRPFTFGGAAGPVGPLRLRAKTASRTANTVGWAGLGLSFVTFVGSFGCIALGAAIDGASDSNGRSAFVPIGLVGLGVTAVLLGISIPLLASSRTEVYSEGGQRLAQRKPPGMQWTLQGLRF